jgi:hypothetical protein
LKTDPREFVNLAGVVSYGPLILEYAQNLLSWRMIHDEQTLTHIMLTAVEPISRRAPRY